MKVFGLNQKVWRTFPDWTMQQGEVVGAPTTCSMRVKWDNGRSSETATYALPECNAFLTEAEATEYREQVGLRHKSRFVREAFESALWNLWQALDVLHTPTDAGIQHIQRATTQLDEIARQLKEQS